MNPAVETIEEIEGFLQVFSDPYNEHGQGQPWPEPQLGMAATASAEGSQQGSSQSQVMLASMPTGMISASCSVPGRVLTQSSAGAPEEDLDAILQDLVEIFERNQQVTSCEQVNLTAAYQKTQAMGTTDCQRANVTANKMTGCDAGSQVQDTSGQKTLKDIQMTTLCGSQVNPHKDHQTLSGGQVTASGLHQIVYWGPMATSLGDQSQSLYLKQMTNTSNDQSLNGGQKMTRSNEQIISGGYQLSAVPRPELPAWTVSPVILEQLPPKHCNLQTKCSAFLKKADRWKSYVCPHQDCGKSYTRSSYLRVHQRTHSGEKPYACNEQGCEWRFSRSDELKRHMKRHTGERPYKCEACSKSFARSDHLTQHQRVHRAFRLGLEPSRL